MKQLKDLELTNLLIYFVLLLLVFITELVLGRSSVSQVALILGTIALISVTSIVLGYRVLWKILDLTERSRQLQQGIDQVYRHRAILVSNDVLKSFEHRANLIRIISPDLYDDQGLFYQTILDNIKSRKRYEYIIPNRPDLINKMERLLQCLKHDAGVSYQQVLPIRYQVVSDIPIVTAYGIYDSSDFEGLCGFVEVRVGPNDDDTSHVALQPNDTHRLSQWFDRLFHQDHTTPLSKTGS